MFERELEAIGKRIEKKRKEKDWTQEMLAEKLNIARNTLTKLEGGFRDFKSTEIINIAKVLGVSTDYLLGIDIDPNHDVSDICRVLPLKPKAVNGFKMLQTRVDEDPSNLLPNFQIEAANHLITDCSKALELIGLYLFGDIEQSDRHIRFEGTNIYFPQSGEYLHNGLLQLITTELVNYRKKLRDSKNKKGV